jgi:hypothetical protein
MGIVDVVEVCGLGRLQHYRARRCAGIFHTHAQ